MADAARKQSAGDFHPVSLDFAERVNDLRRSGLTAKQIAEIVGVTSRQVANWKKGANRPVGSTMDRLLELHYVVGYLSHVYTPSGITIWLNTRNRLLDDRRPADLMAEGDFQPVLDLAIGMTEGFPA